MPPPAPSLPRTTSPDPPLVLVVDDDAGVREAARRWLDRERRYEVMTVPSGNHAFHELPDLPTLACVVADYQMRGANGLYLLDYIAIERPYVGRVMFTGKWTPALAQRAARHSIVPKVLENGHHGYELLVATVELEIRLRRRVTTPFPVR